MDGRAVADGSSGERGWVEVGWKRTVLWPALRVQTPSWVSLVDSQSVASEHQMRGT